jgi:dihydrodipicolinate synthase/N-acetylneuraminate lyase
MTETGDIDWAALERLIDWHIANGTQALRFSRNNGGSIDSEPPGAP